ncbi:MAG: hypothetical protein JSW47_07290 [Phycisphaerales bacterium]|nr:MAG: hypothetical protein JSW47_07290 [Phycisphaerales bacterium]
MVSFSNDADILKYEPILFGELHLPWQVQASGTGGELDGTTFTASGANFASAQVQAGGVIYLRSADGILDGAYEIVAVDSATQLQVSIIRPDPDDESTAPPAATDIAYRISTFSPQASAVGFQLTEYFGIKPGDPDSEVEAEDVQNTNALRRASVFAVISSIYRMLASESDKDNYWKKSLHYKTLFARTREGCRLIVDAGSDGVVDVTRVGGCTRLTRD